MQRLKAYNLTTITQTPKIQLLKTIFFASILLTSNAFANQIENLRGARYCEILLASNSKSVKNVSVYNTTGLNSCPTNLWSKITTSSIKKQTDASFVHLNGPRYWVLDGMTGSTKLVNPKIVQFGGIDMREAAVLNISRADILFGSKPYTLHQVNRETTYIFKANRPIYELINPQNEVFVMQSYSIQKQGQTLTSLDKLGSRLMLPKGWHFRSRILNQDTQLSTVANKTEVVQDDLLNTYQQETPDFIKTSTATE